jgi:CheY-like chemotaxis protein
VTDATVQILGSAFIVAIGPIVLQWLNLKAAKVYKANSETTATNSAVAVENSAATLKQSIDNGRKTDEVHTLVNSRMTDMIKDAEYRDEQMERMQNVINDFQKRFPYTAIPRFENRKILLVDDSKEDIELMMKKCVANGCRPEVAHSMAEVWQLIGENGGFDAVFLDLTLPDASAKRLLNTIRKLKPHVDRIYVCTGDNSPERQTEALAYGADGFLWKSDPKFDTKLAALLQPHD